jgi:hypothetical protein
MSLDKLVEGAVTGYCDLQRRGVEVTIDEYLARFPEEMRVKLRLALETVVVLDDLARRTRRADIGINRFLKPMNRKERLQETLEARRNALSRPGSFAPYMRSVEPCSLFPAIDPDAEKYREWARPLSTKTRKRTPRPRTAARSRRKK